MAVNSKEVGKTIKQKESVPWFIKMEINMLVIMIILKSMDMELIHIQTTISMKGNSSMICSMVKEY